MIKFRQNFISVLLVLGVGLTPYVALAAADCGKEEQKEGTEMSEDTFSTVQTATELLGKQKYDEAIEKLSKIADKGSAYEKALVNYNLGLAYSSKQDFKSAVKAFAAALTTDSLPRANREQLRYNLGQLYIVTQQFDEGIKTLETYVSTACGTIPPEAHIFLANALSEKKRYAEALPQIDLAISKSKEIKEQWLQMKLAIAYELKDYKGAAESLVQLIVKFPQKPDYWRQLSSVLYEGKSEPESLAVLALAERQGFLQKPAEIKNLFSIYMMLESPNKAGLLLETAMAKSTMPANEENLSSLSDAWINAREADKAEATLKQLAAMSDKGDYYYKLGAMYGDNERWQDSKGMLTKALQKGGLKRAGDVWMRLAVANYGMKDNNGAVEALQKATTFDESRAQANEWLKALNAKQI
ncbi:MAG: tetratricopeptide repeat protein [Gammaproteobacteria bacterium]|nr:MAG: tetratricopeptide repeat protein [Gammaproteobacteria bacterium]